MKKTIQFALLILLVSALPACKGTKKDGQTFFFNPEKGKVYGYEMIWELNQEGEGASNSIVLLANYNMTLSDVKDTLKTLRTVYKHFKMDMNVGEQLLSVDTNVPVDNSGATSLDEIAADPSKMMARMFTGIKGKEFDVVVNDKGDIQQVNGFNEILQSMMDSAQLPEQMLGVMKQTLQEQFNEQSIKDQFRQVFSVFPGKPVSPGDSWERTFSVKSTITAKFMSTYTFEKVEGDKIFLKLTTKITSEPGSETKLSGDQEGSLVLDRVSGMTRIADFVQHINVETGGVTVKMNGKGMVKGSF